MGRASLAVTLTTALFTTAIALTFTPVASAQPPCMDRYWEQDVGPYTIVSRSTCHYSIEPNEDWEGPPGPGPGDLFQPASTSGPSGPDCSYRYWEAEIGPVHIVSRSSCHYDVHIHEDWRPDVTVVGP